MTMSDGGKRGSMLQARERAIARHELAESGSLDRVSDATHSFGRHGGIGDLLANDSE